MTPAEQAQSDAFERFAALQRRRQIAPTRANVRAAEKAFAEFERLFRPDPSQAAPELRQ